jgi:uncharacterized protein (DUF1778 family)
MENKFFLVCGESKSKKGTDLFFKATCWRGINMSSLSLRLPNSVHRHIKEIALHEGVSINQFISSAVSEKISAIITEDYLNQRANRADRAEFKNILDKVPDSPPLPGDGL